MLRETAPFADIMQHFLTSDLPVCFIVDQTGRLLGEISIHDVKAMLQEDTLGPLVIAKDLIQRSGSPTSPDETLARCLEKFTATDQEYLPVVSPTLELQGIISRRDVLDLYNREILRHEHLGLSLRTERAMSTAHEQVRLPREYVVEVVQVPARFVGKTLRETQLRTHFNLTAVAIRRGGFHNHDELPDPDRPLGRQDYLVLVGHPLEVQRFVVENEEMAQPLNP
jgi:hypothetical protein